MTTSNDHELAEEMLASYRFTKTQVCERHRGPADLGPMLDVRYVDGSTRLACIDDRALIVPALRQMRSHASFLGTIETYVGFLADAYGSERPLSDPPQRGDLERAFHAGDVAIAEILTALVYDVRAGHFVAAEMRYTYGDDGLPRFDAVKTRPSHARAAGFVPDAIREGIK